MARFRTKTRPVRTFKARPRALPAGRHMLVIDRMADDGRGIAKHNGKTVFVKGALPGERVEVGYSASHKKYDEAELLNIVESSAVRTEPRCRYFGQCGGCDIQHVNYLQQISSKQQRLDSLFSLPSLNSGLQWLPPISASPWHYRHRARLAVSAGRNHCTVGFRQQGSHRIVSVECCDVLHSALSEQLASLQQLIASLPSRSLVEELSITEDSHLKRGVVIFCRRKLSASDFTIIAAYCSSHKIQVELYLAGTSTQRPFWRSGNAGFIYVLEDQSIELQFSLLDFTQVNPVINQQIINQVIEWLFLGPNDQVADFFCGVGNFSLPVAQYAGSVTAYEVVPEMTKKAAANAERNNLKNLQFLPADLMAPTLAVTEGVNKALLDPPRAGAEHLCRQLCSSSISHIVYISCNPRTLLRDADILTKGGFKLQAMVLADMFPQTMHCEVIALFTGAGAGQD